MTPLMAEVGEEGVGASCTDQSTKMTPDEFDVALALRLIAARGTLSA